MSGYNNNWSDDEGFEQHESQGGAGLRKMLEDTLAENRRLAEELKASRREDATAVLKDKGLDPALAELIPEGTKPSEWVEKYAPLLGVKQETVAFEDERQSVPEVVMSDDDDPAIVARRAELAAERAALADMQNAAEQGFPASVQTDLIQKMDQINSEDELLKFFRENGAPLD